MRITRSQYKKLVAIGLGLILINFSLVFIFSQFSTLPPIPVDHFKANIVAVEESYYQFPEARLAGVSIDVEFRENVVDQEINFILRGNLGKYNLGDSVCIAKTFRDREQLHARYFVFGDECPE